jgi:hypothetical protein
MTVIEHRKYIRFLVPDNAFAVSMPAFAKVGKIKDISIKGLAFEYITDETSETEISHVNILLRDDGFELSKIPCQAVYDVLSDRPGPGNGSEMKIKRRRCGIQYKTLSAVQRVQLEKFLKKYTIGLVPEK